VFTAFDRKNTEMKKLASGEKVKTLGIRNRNSSSTGFNVPAKNGVGARGQVTRVKSKNKVIIGSRTGSNAQRRTTS
jgi:hypothetical protein